MRDQIHACRDAEALAYHARDWLVAQIERHRLEHETPYSLALSGGGTPQRLYQLLGELPVGTIDWGQVILVWGDERNVPPEDSESNFRMVKESLLDYIAIPAQNILAVPEPGASAEDAAAAYETLLRERLPTDGDQPPRLDCVLLGIGDDVHTASLFPQTEALQEKTRWVVANRVPQLDCWRITLTAPFINASRNVAFLASGPKKTEALERLWCGPVEPLKYPAQLIRPTDGSLRYFVDIAAMGTTPLPASVMVQMI